MIATTPKTERLAQAKRKKRRQKAQPPPPLGSEAIRLHPLVKNLSDKALKALAARGEGVTFQRDELIFKQGDASKNAAIYFIIAGQVGCGSYTEAVSEAQKKKTKNELFKHVGQNYFVLGDGDVLFSELANVEVPLCLYGITEVQAIRFQRDQIDNLMAAYPALKEALRTNANHWLARLQTIVGDSARSELFDFYVKHGFSFSTRTKIRQLEICIDCDRCVQACEDRHGFARIERFGPEVGLINFSVTCRQCYDPRCLIDCNFDAIARDPVSKEIRIELENCTGCSVCARNCPNDSIFIHNVTPEQDLSIWDLAGKKAPKKIATKCDRCAGYEDMACIAECPTGSMIDVLPADIFALGETEKPLDPCTTDPFESGWTEKHQTRLLPKICYGIALFLTALCGLEWFLRLESPHLSFLPVFTADLNTNPTYAPGYGFGFSLGVLGSICIWLSMVYSARVRLEKETQWLGSKYLWFSLHNALGVLGPALVFLHGNLQYKSWPFIGVITCIGIVLSGFVGQYLANKIPGQQFLLKKERLDLHQSLTQMSEKWGEHTQAANLAALMLAHAESQTKKQIDNLPTWRILFVLLSSDFQRWWKLQRLKWGQIRKVRNKELRKKLARLMDEKLLLDQQDLFFRAASRFFAKWRRVHIFFCIGLLLLMTVHVFVVLIF